MKRIFRLKKRYSSTAFGFPIRYDLIAFVQRAFSLFFSGVRARVMRVYVCVHAKETRLACAFYNYAFTTISVRSGIVRNRSYHVRIYYVASTYLVHVSSLYCPDLLQHNPLCIACVVLALCLIGFVFALTCSLCMVNDTFANGLGNTCGVMEHCPNIC